MAELEEAVSESLKLFNVVNIKQEQKRILEVLTKNNDCMAIHVLPTGFGNSLPYQLLIPVRKAMGQFEESHHMFATDRTYEESM